MHCEDNEADTSFCLKKPTVKSKFYCTIVDGRSTGNCQGIKTKNCGNNTDLTICNYGTTYSCPVLMAYIRDHCTKN